MRFLLLFAFATALVVTVYLGLLYGTASYHTVQAELNVATAQVRPARYGPLA